MTILNDGEETESLIGADDAERSGCERIITPRFVLAMFTLVNFITYYDRGAIAACLSDIRSDPSIAGAGEGTISEAKGGFIVSAFMVGFMVTCPLFASLGSRFTAKQIILCGLVVWACACVATAFAHGYAMILMARMFVGVGEAAYAGFTVTIIDNIAPKPSRTLWIGTFYSMIPVGTAIGMAAGGIISSDGGFGSVAGWRVVFVSEVVAALPIMLFVCFLPDRYNPQKAAASDGSIVPPNDLANPKSSIDLKTAVKALLRNPEYLLVVFGYGMYVFVVGAIAVWAITMLVQGPMRLSNVAASSVVGGATALTGVFGSVAGGLFVDKMGGSQGLQGTLKCQKFDMLMIAICVPTGLVALFAEKLFLFGIFFVISVFALFAVTAPVNASILTVVPLNLRTYAISFSVFAIHAMGDFPSPALSGAISDQFGNGCPDLKTNTTCLQDPGQDCVWIPQHKLDNAYCANKYQLRNALSIVFAMLVLAIPAWFAVYLRVKRRLEDDAHPRADAESLRTTNHFRTLSDN
jgi:MFS family permease